MSPAVDGQHPEIEPDLARRMARIASLSFHPAEHLAAMLVDTEQRVADLEREQLAREVSALSAGFGLSTERQAADRAAVIAGYRDAVREREALRRERFDRQLAPLVRFTTLVEGLDDLVVRGRRGELSMHGLVPVSALVDLLDAARQSGEPITDPTPYVRGAACSSAGPDPEDPPAPPDGAR